MFIRAFFISASFCVHTVFLSLVITQCSAAVQELEWGTMLSEVVLQMRLLHVPDAV